MVMFPYSYQGHASAWFVSDGMTYLRWIQSGDKTHFTAAGVGSMTSAPSYAGELSLLGATPP